MLALILIPSIIGLGMMLSPFDLAEFDRTQEDDDSAPRPTVGGLTNLVEPDTSDSFAGSENAERLVGNNSASEMHGLGGDDVLLGNGGDDAIDAGAGDDTVYGGSGDDNVSGGQGVDRVFLGDGNDSYAPQSDTSTHDAGNDFVRGGAGADLIVDLAGSNALFGDLGSDTLVGFDGLNDMGVYETEAELRTTDSLTGGYGNDTLAGDFGDILTGGADADTFIVADGEGPGIEEIHVTDFNTGEDNLIIYTHQFWDALGSIDLAYDEDRGGVRASFEGRSVAILEGLTAADIPDINVALTPFEVL